MIIASSPIDICKMSLKDIYTVLLHHNLLKGLDNEIIPLHMETILPWISWKTTWKCLRIKGIHGIAASTTYKYILNILPSHERLARVRQNNSNMCPLYPNKIKDVWHVISQCVSKEAANYLLLSIQCIQPSTCIPDVLYLQWERPEHFLPLTWLATLGIDIIWSNRLSGGIKILQFY